MKNLKMTYNIAMSRQVNALSPVLEFKKKSYVFIYNCLHNVNCAKVLDRKNG